MTGIVILNYENWEDTRRCLESIRRYPPREDYMVFLVDNASRAKPAYDLQKLLQTCRAQLLQNEKNLGYNAGNNTGIAKAVSAGCDYILIANNDVCFCKGSIQRMTEYLKQHPKTGIVGPKVVDVKGRLTRNCLCQKTGLAEKYLVRTRLHILFPKRYARYFGYDKDYKDSFRVYAVHGCCLMMSRACAQAVTPFDEYPFLYEEELILGIRMEEAGFATVCQPAAAVRHLHGGSTRYQKAFSFAHNVRSEIYYCRNYLHARPWQIWPLYIYRVTLYLLRCIRYKDFRQKWKWFFHMTRQEIRK